MRAFLDAVERDGMTKELVVLNRTEPEPVQRLLAGAFGDDIAVSEERLPDCERDVVVLVEGEGTERAVVASSPLQSVMDSFLLVNSDTFLSGFDGIDEFRLPDVLSGMDEVVFRLRGYRRPTRRNSC